LQTTCFCLFCSTHLLLKAFQTILNLHLHLMIAMNTLVGRGCSKCSISMASWICGLKIFHSIVLTLLLQIRLHSKHLSICPNVYLYSMNCPSYGT
jgi:hypothetical protein